MNRHSNDEFDDEDLDFDFDEDAAEDDGPLPESDDPDFDAIDPEFDNVETPNADEAVELRNPDGTLKPNWEDLLQKLETRQRDQRHAEKLSPSPREEPATPSGHMIVFEPRPGNYILAVGLPGSGKTVLQSHILHFLFNSSKYDAGTDRNPDSPESQLSTLNYWKRCWREGRFPEATQLDRADHFRYIIRTHSDDIINRRYKFGFVEVSGEHLRRLEGVADDKPELPESLQNLLANKKCRIVFLLVCNPAKDPKRDDDFFHSFIDYFNFYPELKFRRESPIAFVLANPKAAKLYIEPALDKAIDRGQQGSDRNKKLREVRSSVRDSRATGRQLARLYLRLVMTKTKGALNGWEGPKNYFGFSVGETRYNRQWGESEVVNFEFDDAKRVFSWVYKQTTRIVLPRFFGIKLFDDND